MPCYTHQNEKSFHRSCPKLRMLWLFHQYRIAPYFMQYLICAVAQAVTFSTIIDFIFLQKWIWHEINTFIETHLATTLEYSFCLSWLYTICHQLQISIPNTAKKQQNNLTETTEENKITITFYTKVPFAFSMRYITELFITSLIRSILWASSWAEAPRLNFNIYISQLPVEVINKDLPYFVKS